MYIAIEGPKGSGKSTLVESIKKFCIENDIDIAVYEPTRKTSAFSFCEVIFFLFEKLGINSNLLKKYTYKSREVVNSNKCDFKKELIVSDRSVLTNYSSRLTDSHTYNIEEALSNKPPVVLPTPDILVFLDFDVHKCHLRTHGRSKQDNAADCSIKKIRKSKWAFKKLLLNKNLIGLEKTKIVSLDESYFPVRPEYIFNLIKGQL